MHVYDLCLVVATPRLGFRVIDLRITHESVQCPGLRVPAGGKGLRSLDETGATYSQPRIAISILNFDSCLLKRTVVRFMSTKSTKENEIHGNP